MAYGEIEYEDMNAEEKFIHDNLTGALIVFEYTKNQKQMTLEEWNTRGRPITIIRGTRMEKRFGNLPFNHAIYPDFAYGHIIVLALKKKMELQTGHDNVSITASSGKLKGLIACCWETDKLTCFNVI